MKLTIYNLLIMLLIPAFQVRILFKSIKDKGYRKNFSQRYGRNLVTLNRQKKKIIWFHAVSLGEVIGSQDVMKTLLKNCDVVLTTSTPTGLKKAQEIYKDTLAINYAPWDLSLFINRFLDFYQPDALLIFETEIWPAMISSSFRKRIPIFLVNARLSLKSYQAYSKTLWLIKDILKMINFIFVQTQKHKDRFLQLGIREGNIQIVGSVKFDGPGLNPQSLDLPHFILGASTHAGEEEIILRAFQRLGKSYPYKLFICPRHPERSVDVFKLSTQMNFTTQLYSKLNSEDYEVCIVDSIGYLPDFYNEAHLAFVGGSLIPRGGHNLIEPAILGAPIITGNHTFNFEEIVEEFVSHDSCIVVNNENELLAGMKLILDDQNTAIRLIENAHHVVALNQGSTDAQVSYILNELGEKP